MAEAKAERRPAVEEKPEKVIPPSAGPPRSPLFSPAGFMVTLVLVVVAGIGGYTVSGMFGKPADAPPVEDAKYTQDWKKISLDAMYATFVDNVSPTQGAYKRLTVSPTLFLKPGVDDESRAKLEKIKEKIRDTVQELLYSRGNLYKDVSTPEAMKEIKERIRKQLNKDLEKDLIDQVYFSGWDFKSD